MFRLGADGVFTDFTATGVLAQAGARAREVTGAGAPDDAEGIGAEAGRTLLARGSRELLSASG